MAWVGLDGVETLFHKSLPSFGRAWPLNRSRASVRPRNVDAIHQRLWTKVFGLQVCVCPVFFCRFDWNGSRKRRWQQTTSQITGEEAIANIPVAILTSECGLPNALLCSFAGCMRWASRFGSQMFLSSCLDSLEAISEAYVAFVMCSFVWNCF